MGFIDAQTSRLLRAIMAEGVSFVWRGMPKDGVVDRGDIKVLSNAFDPGGDPVDCLTGTGHHGNLAAQSMTFDERGIECGTLTLLS